jgi:hypothetical protein
VGSAQSGTGTFFLDVSLAFADAVAAPPSGLVARFGELLDRFYRPA